MRRRSLRLFALDSRNVAGAGSNFFAGRKAQTGFPDKLGESHSQLVNPLGLPLFDRFGRNQLRADSDGSGSC